MGLGWMWEDVETRAPGSQQFSLSLAGPTITSVGHRLNLLNREKSLGVVTCCWPSVLSLYFRSDLHGYLWLCE